MADAVVVGAGPNGLAAAVALARQGVRVTVLEGAATIGGGTRSGEFTLPGLLHDQCAAVHPMALASPFLRGLGLERHGLVWRWPELELAHPLDAGEPGVLHRSPTRTAERLGTDGPGWYRTFAPLASRFDALAADLLSPPLQLPSHPVALARFAVRAALPAALLARRWRTPAARALFAGIAAHAMTPLTAPGSSAIGLILAAAGQRHGWPVAEGGSRRVTDALAARLAELGGRIETGRRVRSLAELPAADAVLLDLAPREALAVCGDRLPTRVARGYARWRHGPAAFKVDLAVEGGIPWRDPDCRRAGTVHLGGTLAELTRTEALVAAGRMPERPFVLVAQQYLADPTRSRGSVHPVWAYAHVPGGWPGDATEAVLAQLERFAPGTRERVLARTSTTVAQLAVHNPNYVAGDILTGATTPRQLVLRPRPAVAPYRTGIPGVFLCSAATPPGPGVHGMCGFNAAQSALRHLAR
ncbi:phytoene desaturase family protein [Kitasatospora sp. NPDC058965]|uniref:phytoene desaturase family protein n=1 Tax=Kitasatospora sp. NPDC058965 TaxID=3346682 RepID=UPI00367D8A52